MFLSAKPPKILKGILHRTQAVSQLTAGLANLNRDDYNHRFKSQLKSDYFLSKIIRFKSQQSVYFRFPFTHKYLTQAHVLFEIVSLFMFSLIIYLYDIAICSKHTKQYILSVRII